MSITSDMLRGHTDTIILTRLAEGDSYGYAISRAFSVRTDGRLEMKEATLYTAFRRLEAGGLIRSYWGDEGVGARRRYYAITPAGQAACLAGRQEWMETKQIIDQLIGQ